MDRIDSGRCNQTLVTERHTYLRMRACPVDCFARLKRTILPAWRIDTVTTVNRLLVFTLPARARGWKLFFDDDAKI